MGGKDTLFRDRPDSQRYRSRWNKSQLQYLFCKHRFGKKTTTMRLGRSTYGVLSATAVAAAIASVALIGSSIFVVESFAPTLVVVGRSSLNNNNNNVRLLLSGGIPSSNFLHPLLSSSSSSTVSHADESLDSNKRSVLLCFNENIRCAADIFRCHNEFIRDVAHSGNLNLSSEEWLSFFTGTKAHHTRSSGKNSSSRRLNKNHNYSF